MTPHIETRLTEIPEPAPPASLATMVMARVARDAVDRSTLLPAPRQPSRSAGWPAWLLATAGLAGVTTVWVTRVADAGLLPSVSSSRLSGVLDGVPTLTDLGPAAALVATGLVVYLFGLFMPLRSR